MNELKVLTPRQRLFVRHWIKYKDPVKAARKVGCKDPVRYANAATKSKKINQALFRLQRECNSRFSIHPSDIIEELARIAFSNIKDIIEWDELEYETDDDGQIILSGGIKIKPSNECADWATSAINLIRQNKDGRVEIKFYDKNSALIHLSKLLDMEGAKDNIDPIEYARKLRKAFDECGM